MVKEAECGRSPGGLATLLHTTDDTGNSPLLVCVESGSRESAQVSQADRPRILHCPARFCWSAGPR